jgi:exodeoxyribonuclease V gamma subunit
LHLSWAGRSARDPAEQPPSVLVAQLRDHLAAVWGEPALRERTVHHPLQPFSRRNFDAAERWRVSHALEWRAVHAPQDGLAGQGDAAQAVVALPVLRPAAPLTLADLQQFLRHPERDHVRRQLLLAFDDLPPPLPQDEDFALDGLAHWQQAQALLQALQRAGPQADAHAVLCRALDRAQRSGALPAGSAGRAVQQALLATLAPQWATWCALQAAAAPEPVPLPVHLVLPDAWSDAPPASAAVGDQALVLSDQITGLSSNGTPGLLQWVSLEPGRLRHKDRSLRPRTLLGAWVRQLAAAAAGQPVQAVLVAADGVLRLAPPAPDDARQTLHSLLVLWRQNQDRPLPLPWTSAVLHAREAGEDRIAAAYDGDAWRPGERREPVLARFWPDSAALLADPAFDAVVAAVVHPLLAHLDTAAEFDALPQGETPRAPRVPTGEEGA